MPPEEAKLASKYLIELLFSDEDFKNLGTDDFDGVLDMALQFELCLEVDKTAAPEYRAMIATKVRHVDASMTGLFIRCI